MALIDFSTAANWKFIGGLAMTVFMAGGMFYGFTSKLEAHEEVTIRHTKQSRVQEKITIRLLTEICRNTARTASQTNRCNDLPDDLVEDASRHVFGQ